MRARLSHLRALVALSTLVSGCATTSHGPPLLPADEPVAIVAMPVGGVIGTIDEAKVAGNALIGVGTGAAAGAVLSVLCGPFAPLCVGPMAAVGAGVGGASGTVGTLMASGAEADRAALRDRLATLRATHPPEEHLVAAIEAEGAGHARIVHDAPTVLAVRFDLVGLKGMGDRGAFLMLGASAWVRREHGTGVVDEPAHSFRLEQPIAMLEPDWRTDPEVFERDFDSACRELARQIVHQMSPAQEGRRASP
jgi:hypothetical protein